MDSVERASLQVAESLPDSSKVARFELVNIGSVAVPTAAFSKPNAVIISVTADEETAVDFKQSSAIFGPLLRAVDEVRVNTGLSPPTLSLQAALLVPSELLARMTSNNRVEAFVQIYQDGGLSILDNFEHVPSSYDASANILTIELLPSYFTARRRLEDTYEAVIILGLIP